MFSKLVFFCLLALAITTIATKPEATILGTSRPLKVSKEQCYKRFRLFVLNTCGTMDGCINGKQLLRQGCEQELSREAVKAACCPTL